MAVDPYKGEIYPITFGVSGMMAHENRWLAKATELIDAANVTFENDVLQKDTAVQVYDPIGVDAPAWTMTATSTAAGNWEGGVTISTALLALPQTPVLIKNIVVTGQASPWTFTVAGTALVPSTVVISLWAASINVPTITDSKGNTYTEVVGLNATNAPSDPAGTAYMQFDGQISTQLTNGVDTITLTWTGGAANIWLIAASYPTIPVGWAERATANPTSTTAFSCPKSSPAPFVADIKAFSYPLWGVGGTFLDQDTATATITATNGYTIEATANRVGFGQLVQMYKPLGNSAAILGQFDWNSQFNAGAIAGTVTVTQGVTTVLGAGTSFTTTFNQNDEIIVGGETQSVNTVTNNGTLDTYNPWQQRTASGLTATRRAGPHIVTAAIDNVAGTNITNVYKEGGSPARLAGFTIATNIGKIRQPVRFVLGGKESAAQSRKLFMFNGIFQVAYLPDDATTMSNLAAYPADWATGVDPNKNPINGIVHQGALFGFGNLSDPHRIYRSQTSDQTSFTGGDSGQYPIASSIGERLWGAAEYQGVLWLWKYPRGIFYFDDTDTNFLNWSYHIRSEALGCAPAAAAVLPIDDDILFCAPDGHFHLLSAVPALGGTETSDITRQLGLHRWTREHVHIPSLNLLCSAWNSYTKTAYFGVRSRQATQLDNDLLLAFDFSAVLRGGPIRFRYSTAFIPNSLCIRRSSTTGNPKDGTPLLMIGETSTSMLQLLDDGTVGTKLTHGFRNDPKRESRYVSTSYAITAQTPRLDFSDADPMNRQRRKNFDSIEFIFGEADISDLSGQTVTAQVYVDSVLKQTITLANVTTTRVLRQLRCGDGFDWQVKLSTSSVISAAAASPTLIPDMVGLGLQVYWRPGSQDHGNTLG